MQNTVLVSAEEHGTTRHVCEGCVHFPSVLDAFRNVAKGEYYFHYVRPSVRPTVYPSVSSSALKTSAHVGHIFVKFLI